MCFRRHAVAAAIASSASATTGLPTPVRPSGSTRPTGFGNRRGRERGAPLRQPCLRLLALASLCLANPVPVAIVQAQTETTLVSNAGQTSELDTANVIAQLFTTGSQAGGYTFTTVDIYLGTQNFDGGCTATGSVAVSIYSNNQSNQPDSSVYSLTAPSALIDEHFLVAEQRWMVGHLMDPRRRRSSQFCSAKTNRLLPALGRSSGVRRVKPDAVPDVPVLTATYCRPSTA